MPEAEPILKQEHLHAPSPEEHIHAHVEAHDHFTATAEHGSQGHVCSAECNHTQQEADQFADNLFSQVEARHAEHGESGHVCDASCKHTQTEADNFAESLFKDHADHNHSHEKINHGEKGHVCTSECKHTQAGADSFADKLFDTAKEQAAHGEKGHVCDANCKHTQEQADQFADELFAEKAEQSQSAKVTAQVHEQAVKVNKVEEASSQTKVDLQAQEALRALHKAQTARDTGVETNGSEMRNKPELKSKDQAAEKFESEAADNHAVITKQVLVAEQAERQITHEGEVDNLSEVDQVVETTFNKSESNLVEVDTDNLFENRALQVDIPEAELNAINIEDQIGSLSPDTTHNDAADFEDSETIVTGFELDTFSENEIIEVAAQAPFAEGSIIDEVEGVMLDFSDDIDQGNETLSSSISNPEGSDTNSTDTAELSHKVPETIEEVLAIVPELEPIKRLVPTISEYIADSSDEAKLLQEIEPVLDKLIKLLPDLDSQNEISAELSEQLSEQLELLSMKLGISSNDLLQSLEIDPENIELSQLLYEILHGLKKWLSLEYSLEFTSSKSQSATSANSARDPRTLGQLILSMLQNVKVPYPSLGSA